MMRGNRDRCLRNPKYRVRFIYFFFFFQAEDGIRDLTVTGVQTCALPILLIRTPSDPIALQQAVREAVRSMDAGLPAPSGTTMEQVLSDAVAPRRFSFVLLAIFGLLAATLAAVGLYGVLAYLVADRTREIGIRLALGAEPLRLVRLVVEQGMWLAVLRGANGPV